MHHLLKRSTMQQLLLWHIKTWKHRDKQNEEWKENKVISITETHLFPLVVDRYLFHKVTTVFFDYSLNIFMWCRPHKCYSCGYHWIFSNAMLNASFLRKKYTINPASTGKILSQSLEPLQNQFWVIKVTARLYAQAQLQDSWDPVCGRKDTGAHGIASGCQG